MFIEKPKVNVGLAKTNKQEVNISALSGANRIDCMYMHCICKAIRDDNKMPTYCNS